MKDIITKVESIVVGSIKLLDKIEIKETNHKYTNGRKDTHLSLSISFDSLNNLSWVNASFQNGIHYQFSVMLSMSLGHWYKSVQFGSDFYNLPEKDQIKRMNYFLKNYSKLVKMLTDDKNILRKKELLQKQKEIQDELSSM